jgi:WD40 repeat protein
MRPLALILVLLLPLPAAAEEPKLLASLSPRERRFWIIYSLAFTRDGKTLAAGSPDRVSLWELASWKLRKSFSYGASSLSFSRDGRSLAIGYAHDGVYKALVLEVSTGSVCCVLRGGGPVEVVLSPDGRLLATGGDAGLQLWDAVSGKKRSEIFASNEPNVHGLSLSPDGRFLAVGRVGFGITVWDVADRRRLVNLAATPWQHSLSFSDDGNTLASQEGLRTVKTWDLRTCAEQFRIDSEKDRDISALALSPDGRMLAIATRRLSRNSFVELVEVPTRKRLARLRPPHGAASVAFSPDGKLLAVGDTDNTVWVWKLPQLGR